MILRLLGVVLTALLVSCQAREPFFGDHQAGIVTPGQKFAFVAAFDVTTSDATEVRALLKHWTRAAEALTQGLALGEDGPPSAPADDTGEVLGYKPARLTLTFGFGPSLFDRFSLRDRPAALEPLPVFNGDRLRPEWSDGDLVVQVAADDYQTAYHALHTLTRWAKGTAVVRWVQDGFQPGLEVNPQGPARNLQGFLDGTKNPDVTNPDEMNRVVWAEGPGMEGGSYLVVRRIRMFVEVWDRTSLGDQQRTIGRDRAHGEELPAMGPDSHVVLARGGGVEKILRRPFHYVNGLDERTKQWDSGLLFLAWMKDPRMQFVPIQTRLSNYDLLNEYIQVQGSAVFAVLPGVKKGGYLGADFFPEPPLATRIEGLLGAVGQTYPALAREDWSAVREGAGVWKGLWKEEFPSAGPRAASIEAAGRAWALALAEDTPRVADVRRAQTDLVRALEAWHADASPRSVGSVTDVAVLQDRWGEVSAAVARADAGGAQRAFSEFQREWTRREALVRNMDSSAYGQIELSLARTRLALTSPLGSEATTQAAAVAAQLHRLQPPAFGPWDAGFLLFREGLEALLVLAALLAFLNKTQQSRRAPWVWAGAGTGLAISVGAALVVSTLMAAWVSAAPELIEGLTGLVAVVLMLTAGIWIHRKAAVKNWNLWIKDQLGRAGGRSWALAALAFVAVLREGAETVVFFWGLAGSLSMADLLIGIGGALVVLTILGVLMIGFSKRLPLQWFFPVATGLISFLAVKILGQSLSALQTVGWIDVTPLGFGGPVDFLGFSPTWQTAAPQLILLVVLAVWILRPLWPQKSAT